VVSDFFREAIAEITGDSWLDDLARASWRAAEEKFSPDYVPPAQLRVSFPGLREVQARDSYLAMKAIQNATTKLAHIIRNPGSETNIAYAADRAKAPLLLRSQAANVIVFGFPVVEDEVPPGTLVGTVSETLAVQAARELVNVLPSSAEDDAALDAVLAQRRTVRNAVNDIVMAVPPKADGLSFQLTPSSGESVFSVLSRDQASMLRDSLQEMRVDRRTVLMAGRLDGVRTKRRIFYLEPESGGEIHGALDLESMDDIRANLDRNVLVRLEEERTQSVSGQRSQPRYRLLSIEPSQGTL
jgi:hypothetical protein